MADPSTIARLERALDEKEYAIEAIRAKLEAYSEEVEQIHAQTSANDEEMRELQKQQKESDKNPRNINAEDAFDTLIRLESTLKIIEKRNAVLDKDNAARNKALRDSGKSLEKASGAEQKLIAATGYHPEHSGHPDKNDTFRENSERAKDLEAAMRKEIVSAEVVIKKKQTLIADLTKKVEEQQSKEDVLVQVFNDIRVADRDVQTASKQLDALKADYGKIETSLIIAAENDGKQVAVKSLQGDREFMKEEIRKHKTDKARQEKVIAAQLSRTKFLQDRLDVVLAALRDMRLEKDLDRVVGRDLVVAEGGDPEDPDRILPANELIPVEVYELLHRDYEAMRSIADRKAILVTEKTCTTDAQMATIMMYQAQMEMTTKQQDQTRLNNKLEQHEAVIEVTRLVEEFRRELAKLVNENARLKAILQDQQNLRRTSGGQEMLY